MRAKERGWASLQRKRVGTHPRSCVKLQMGQATSLCLWRESGMTGCSRSYHGFASISPSFTAFEFPTDRFNTTAAGNPNERTNGWMDD